MFFAAKPTSYRQHEKWRTIFQAQGGAETTFLMLNQSKRCVSGGGTLSNCELWRGKGARGVRQIFVFLQELFIVKENQAEGAFIATPPLSRNLSRPKRFNALANLDQSLQSPGGVN